MKRKKLAKCNCSENRAVFESFAKSSAIKKGITYNFDFKCCTDSQCSYLDPITNALWDGWKLSDSQILPVEVLYHVPNLFITTNIRHDGELREGSYTAYMHYNWNKTGEKINCDELADTIKSLEQYKIPKSSILEIIKDLIK